MSIFYEAEDSETQKERIKRKLSVAVKDGLSGKKNNSYDRLNKMPDKFDEEEKARQKNGITNKLDHETDESKFDTAASHAMDAYDRHLRRHPQHEFTSIFY